MKYKIYLSCLALLLAMPTAVRSAAEPISKAPNAAAPLIARIRLQTNDKTHFEVPKQIAILSNTIAHMIEDLPSEEEYLLDEIDGQTFNNALDLMHAAFDHKRASSKYPMEQIRYEIINMLVGYQVKHILATGTIDNWIAVLNAIEYLDIEILNVEIVKKPLAERIIKYIYRSHNGDREEIEAIVLSLPISATCKALLAKYWYLNFGYERAFILPGDLDYEFSLEELSTYNKLPIVHGFTLNLGNLKLNDLTGLSNIPGIESVKELFLATNKLTTLPETAFSRASSLETLSLSNNRLIELPEKIFKGLKHLEWLNLGNNQLTTLSPEIFRNLPQLNFIHLGGNPLKPEIKKALKDELGDKVHF